MEVFRLGLFRRSEIGCRVCLTNRKKWREWMNYERILHFRRFELMDARALRIHIMADPDAVPLQQLIAGVPDSELIKLVADYDDPRFLSYSAFLDLPHKIFLEFAPYDDPTEAVAFGIYGKGVEE